jgi:hypothetical protein
MDLRQSPQGLEAQDAAPEGRRGLWRLAYYHSLAMVCYKNLTSTQCRRIVEIVDADLLRESEVKPEDC